MGGREEMKINWMLRKTEKWKAKNNWCWTGCAWLEREIKESRILYSVKRVIINNPFIISMVSNEMIAQISK